MCVDLPSRRGGRRVLEGVSFDVDEGEFVCVVGRSGSGKTTLLRVLGGLLDATPDSVVECWGRPVDGPPEGVSLVFQDYAASLLPWRTVAKNVALGLEGRLPKAQIAPRVAQALSTVGLADRADDHPWQMSGGMQQRVQLARALAMEGSVLLMDEPFGSLDAMTRAALQRQVQQVHQQTRATVVFVTHDIDEAVLLSDRILVLAGSPASIVQQVTVDLPRPREDLETKALAGFHRLRREVYDAVAAHA